MLAVVTDLDGTITGVHRTWLARGGSGKAPIATPRRAMGRFLGVGVRFGDMLNVVAVGQGSDTIFALRCVAPFLPVFAALSARDITGLILPLRLRPFYFSTDNDESGTHAASTLGRRATWEAIEPLLLRAGISNFNADLRRIGHAQLAARVRARLAPADLTATHGRCAKQYRLADRSALGGKQVSRAASSLAEG